VAQATESLDLARTLNTLTHALVPRLADVCVVDLAEHDDVERTVLIHGGPAKLPTVGVRSVLHIPLQRHDRVLGVLSLFTTSADRRHYDAEDMPLLQGIAERAGLAIANAQLYEHALKARRPRGPTR
jgi:GAF domain-containing protein